jgi:hypothetical protein
VIVYYAAQHRNNVLTERAIAAVVLSVVGSIAALLGLGRLGLAPIGGDGALVLLSIALVMVSLPQIIWALSLLTGRFR